MPRRHRLDRSAGTATCPRSEGVRSRRTTGLRGAVVRTDDGGETSAGSGLSLGHAPSIAHRQAPAHSTQIISANSSGLIAMERTHKTKKRMRHGGTCRIDQRCSQRGHALPLRAGQNWRCSRRFGRDNRGSGLRFVRVERTSLRPPRRPGRLIEQVPSNHPNRETLFLA